MKVRTNYVGNQQGIRILKWVSSISPFPLLLTYLSLGNLWRSKVPPRVAFFSCTASLGKILTTENLWYKGVTVVDGALCVKRVGNQWITFSFIVLLLMIYGLWCGLFLVFNGLCRMGSLIYFWVGKVPLVGIGALIYGGLFLIVSYGVFGESGTQDVSKGRSGLLQILNLFFFTPC